MTTLFQMTKMKKTKRKKDLTMLEMQQSRDLVTTLKRRKRGEGRRG